VVNYNNPFLTSVGGSRSQFLQPPPMFMQPPPQAAQPSAQPGGDQYDFAGWADRLDRIESGIGSLTKQFNSFQTPGDVAPEYMGNAAPEPLEQTVNAPEPLPLEPTSMADWMGGYEFDLAPTMGTTMQEFTQNWRTENPNFNPSTQGGGFGPQSAFGAWNQAQQDFQNTPEYLQWQQRQEERGPLSAATEEAIRGGERYSSIGGTTINPYVQGGSSYENYLSAIERAKENYVPGGPPQRPFRMGPPNPQTAVDGPGVRGITGLSAYQGAQGGGQALLQQRQMMMDPESMMGGPKYNPLSQEEYERQAGVWKGHQEYKQFSKQAREQLGMDPGVWRASGANPMFGHAFQEWQQFNQGQEGGPYTNPNQPSGIGTISDRYGKFDPSWLQHEQQPQLFDANRGAQTNLNTLSQVGLGALKGPTQQKIQQGLGSFSQGAGI